MQSHTGELRLAPVKCATCRVQGRHPIHLHAHTCAEGAARFLHRAPLNHGATLHAMGQLQCMSKRQVLCMPGVAHARHASNNWAPHTHPQLQLAELHRMKVKAYCCNRHHHTW